MVKWELGLGQLVCFRADENLKGVIVACIQEECHGGKIQYYRISVPKERDIFQAADFELIALDPQKEPIQIEEPEFQFNIGQLVQHKTSRNNSIAVTSRLVVYSGVIQQEYYIEFIGQNSRVRTHINESVLEEYTLEDNISKATRELANFSSAVQDWVKKPNCSEGT